MKAQKNRIRRRPVSRAAQTPRWDGEHRQLWLANMLVKTFNRMASCQELILAAFEEEGWPPCIDSPLPGGKGAHERLRNAVKKLNHQLNGLIRLHLDGTGEGITWQLSPRRQRAHG